MPRVQSKLVALVRFPGVFAVALSIPLAVGTVPARAQDIFGFLRALTSPRLPVQPPPVDFRVGPAVEQTRKPRPRPKIISVPQPEIKKPLKPRSPGEMDNPVPALLADSTLRPGDMVMFPDGLRVFTGKPGSQHTMKDFKPLAQAGKALPRSTRKLVAHLLPGENPAWSTAGVSTGGKLAANTKDVETTGSVKRKRR
ncbi:hypothetical protein ACFOYU_21470 [Microvirga sp. GCM10011540]|uniref:hypothetical protein n=1 Tax=Microvirga sp. GCM10011540 TaxID=3317338 RepID=UPI0036103D3B